MPSAPPVIVRPCKDRRAVPGVRVTTGEFLSPAKGRQGHDRRILGIGRADRQGDVGQDQVLFVRAGREQDDLARLGVVDRGLDGGKSLPGGEIVDRAVRIGQEGLHADPVEVRVSGGVVAGEEQILVVRREVGPPFIPR